MNFDTPFINDPEQLKLLNAATCGPMKYTLTNDFLSKYSLQNDLYALSGLLAALLNIDVENITALKILNPIEPGTSMSEKECILDIKLILNHEKIINVEIQSRFQDFWPERSITYLCRNFDQLKPGESYNLVKPCIHIGILTNSVFKKDDPRYVDDFYSEYRLQHTLHHTDYSSKFVIKVLSLNQLENATDAERSTPNGLYYWAKMFKASSWEELKMIAKDNPMMTSLVGTVMKLSAEEKVTQACEARRRYSNDIATYEEMISTREARVNELDAALAEKNIEIADREAALAEKNIEIADREAQIADQEAALADRDAELADKEAALADRDAELADKEAALADRDAKLADKDALIAALQAQLAEKQG